MPWVRFDDQFPLHRKVQPLSDAAYRLHSEAIHWCARNKTDGFVPAEDVSVVSTVRRPSKFIPELVKRGLWIEVDDGWEIHDFLEYQPSKAKVEREQKQKAERQARWKAGKSKRGDASLDASKDAAPSRPAPPPSGERGGGGKSRKSMELIHSWCGQCEERTRMVELDDGRMARCPRCSERRSVS